jgi:heme O synthase-like polyprenyltransferase
MGMAAAFLLYHVGKLAASSSTVRASRLLHASVLYLPVVLVIMVVSKR